MSFMMECVLPEHCEIAFQISLAEERLNEAQLLFNGNFYSGTVSRAYYAMFAATKAALLSKNIEVKHIQGFAQLLVWSSSRPA